MLHNGQFLSVAVTLLAMLVSFIGAPYPFEQRLQHVPTLFALIALAWAARRRLLSDTSFYCILAFWWLHIFGARWIYSYVPYDDWMEAITESRASDQFGWSRNHYDRFVHFGFGVLAVPPLVEILRRSAEIVKPLAMGLAFCIVMTIGGMYEILEWQVAVWMSPEQAEAYNGQQGDIWDPQKDMAFNALGAIVSAAIGMVLSKSRTIEASPS